MSYFNCNYVLFTKLPCLRDSKFESLSQAATCLPPNCDYYAPEVLGTKAKKIFFKKRVFSTKNFVAKQKFLFQITVF